MKISLIHPSRSRPTIAMGILKLWLEQSNSQVPIEYLMCVDSDDTHIKEYESLFSEYTKELNANGGLIFDCEISLYTRPNKSSIEAINCGAKKSEGDLLIVVSDDFLCPPNWSPKLVDALQGKTDYIVKTWDGIQKWLITLPIMDRTYYERFGYIYHPEYKHLFADTEMTEVGHLLGRVIDLQNEVPMFKHVHYITGEVPKDAINEKNDATWNHGEELFNKRKAINFGLSL